MTAKTRQIDCQEVAELLYEYLDGELTSQRADEVKAHLADCSPCTALRTFEEAFVQFLEARTRARGAPETLKRQILDEMLFRNDES